MRIALARLLLSEPDLLVLDEVNTHSIIQYELIENICRCYFLTVVQAFIDNVILPSFPPLDLCNIYKYS